MTHKSLWRSLAWTGGARWVVQLFTWASTIVVARLLAPSDYGVIGMATLSVGIVTMLADSGLGSSVVTLRSLSSSHIAQLHGLSGATGTVLFAMSCALAWPIARFFNAPELPPVIIVMSAPLLLAGWQSVPDALIQKQLRFRALALRDTVRGVSGAAVTVVLATLGYGYWALALGAVAGALAGFTVTFALQVSAISAPRIYELWPAISFGSYTLATRLSWYAWSNSDFFVAGKVLDKAALGAYTLAWTLATVSIEKVTALVVTVTPSFFAAAQADRELLRNYLLTLTSTIAVLTIPMSAGMALVAPDLVPLVLGPQWQPAVQPLIGLSVYAAFGSLTPLLSTVLRVTGDQRFSLQMSLWGLIIMPVTFYVGSNWGAAGIAYGWLVAYPVLAIPQYRKVFARLSLSPAEYWRSLRPAVTCTLLMVAVVVALRYLSPLTLGAARLLISVISGVVTFTSCFVVLYRREARSIWHTLRPRPAQG